MDRAAEERVARARARSRWPLRKFRLGEEPPDDLSSTTTPEERLAMMGPLATEAWRLAGREIPEYTRQKTPTRLNRPGEKRDDVEGA